MSNKVKPRTPVAKLIRAIGFLVGGLTKKDVIPDSLEDAVIKKLNNGKQK